MNSSDLTVEVPSRFRKGLDERFDPSLAMGTSAAHLKGGKFIPRRCVLCDAYNPGFGGRSCEGCPFDKFTSYLPNTVHLCTGCTIWLKLVMENIDITDFSSIVRTAQKDVISWVGEDDEKAIRYLNLLRKEAEKWIRWIE